MNQLAQFKSITTFVFDVDGVMTDGSVQILQNGELSRRMSTRDGYALQWAVQKGYRIAVITRGNTATVVDRLKRLGINDIYLGVIDKKEKLEDYLLMNELSRDEVLYMGDDIPDLAPLGIAGLPTCPADAADEIKTLCHYISPYPGGKGCVRDVLEKVLKLTGDWI